LERCWDSSLRFGMTPSKSKDKSKSKDRSKSRSKDNTPTLTNGRLGWGTLTGC